MESLLKRHSHSPLDCVYFSETGSCISRKAFNDKPKATANSLAKSIIRLRLRLVVKRKWNGIGVNRRPNIDNDYKEWDLLVLPNLAIPSKNFGAKFDLRKLPAIKSYNWHNRLLLRNI